MTNDELAAAFVPLMTEVHARIDALPDGPLKTKAQHKVALAHEALERLHTHFVDGGDVQPFDGTNKPPPAP